MRRTLAKIATVVVTVSLLGSCGHSPGERALSGGAIGAAGGAVVGATVGAPVTGAVVGGAAGAAVGAATADKDRNHHH